MEGGAKRCHFWLLCREIKARLEMTIHLNPSHPESNATVNSFVLFICDFYQNKAVFSLISHLIQRRILAACLELLKSVTLRLLTAVCSLSPQNDKQDPADVAGNSDSSSSSEASTALPQSNTKKLLKRDSSDMTLAEVLTRGGGVVMCVSQGCESQILISLRVSKTNRESSIEIMLALSRLSL